MTDLPGPSSGPDESGSEEPGRDPPGTDELELELPDMNLVERSLLLGARDRGDLQGLYRMNTHDLPLARFVGILIGLGVAPIHNRFVLGAVDWGELAVLSVVLLTYAVASWAVLKGWFHRTGSLHLGFVFVYADLLMFAALVHFTGGPESFYWPIFLIRVADQLWLDLRRALVMIVLSLATYGGLVGLWTALGLAYDPGIEAMKLTVLAGVGASLYLVARGPWDVHERTTATRDLIGRLHDQSLELDEERRRARAASESKSAFLARMSHELRTPLNSVVGFTNLLLKRSADAIGSSEADYLHRIRRNSLHLLALINDILDLARIEQGQMPVQMSRVDLDSLVRGTVDQLEVRAEGRPVRLEVWVPSELDPIQADEIRLRQVLINLVGNALKFTDEGRVDVRIHTRPGTATPQRLDVSDTGVGIAADRLDRIFETFEQGEGSINRRHGGTGLGLAISRQLCVLMGFRLTVDSIEGVGSTFSVWFSDPPRSKAPEPAEEEDSEASAAHEERSSRAS